MITRFEKHMRDYHAGKSKVVSSKELEHILHCKGSDIRNMVNDLRCKDIPVCSCMMGYYLAASVEDINETIAHLNSRVHKIQEAIFGLRWAQKEFQKG